MAKENSQGSFRRGLLSLVILTLLKQKDMYGYQLVQEVELQSGGAITTKEGSLYPVLYNLLDSGFISDQKVLTGKRMTRVYYHLEPEGEAYQAELLQEYLAVVNGMKQLVQGASQYDHCQEQA